MPPSHPRAHTAGLPDQWSFDYDAAQNLLAKTIADECGGDEAVALPLDGSGRNRPGTASGTTLEWDSSGNLSRKGDLTLRYDYRDRLARVEGPGMAWNYVYDEFNRRIQKSDGSQVESTVWAGWQALETRVDGILQERRVFGPGMDEIVRLELPVTDQTYLPLYDHTGNLVLLTDESGEPVERYEYSPFGERYIFVDSSPPVVEQVRQVGGEIWLEISEEVRGTDLAGIQLVDVATAQPLAVTVSQPLTTGRQAGQRVVITPATPPAAGTDVDLVVPASALVDLFGNAATAPASESFTWSALDQVVSDGTAPRLERICVRNGAVEVQFSEEPDLAKVGDVVKIDGLPASWTLGADGYTAVSGLLADGNHVVEVVAGLPLDLAGLSLGAGRQEAFGVTPADPVQRVYAAPVAGQTEASAVGRGLVHGFHGRPVDAETGLLYFRNRYYDPDLGRFVTTDPYGYADAPSLYQFALYSPVNYSDPTGEIASFLVDIGFAAYDTLQLARGRIGLGEYGARMALTGASLLADAATGGFGGGLAARAVSAAGRTGKISRRVLAGAVVVNRGEMAVTAVQGAISAKDALQDGDFGRTALSAAQVYFSAMGMRSGDPKFLSKGSFEEASRLEDELVTITHRGTPESIARKLDSGFLPANLPQPNNALTRFLDHPRPAVWISEGEPTIWNRLMSGMIGHRGSASVTFEVPKKLIRSPGGVLKRWFGKSQRVIEQDVPIPPRVRVRMPKRKD